MSISYNKLLKLLEENNMTSYTITKKYKIVGQATWKKIHEGGHVDTRTIEAFCKLLNCQPGDLIEYVPDDEETVSGVVKTMKTDKKSQNHDSWSIHTQTENSNNPIREDFELIS